MFFCFFRHTVFTHTRCIHWLTAFDWLILLQQSASGLGIDQNLQRHRAVSLRQHGFLVKLMSLIQSYRLRRPPLQRNPPNDTQSTPLPDWCGRGIPHSIAHPILDSGDPTSLPSSVGFWSCGSLQYSHYSLDMSVINHNKRQIHKGPRRYTQRAEHALWRGRTYSTFGDSIYSCWTRTIWNSLPSHLKEAD